MKDSIHINLMLHKVRNHKTPFVLAVYYPVNDFTGFNGQKAFDLMEIILASNKIEFKEVTVYHYTDSAIVDSHIYEWVFDIYRNKYIGDRMKLKSINDFPGDIQLIHKQMLNWVETSISSKFNDLKEVIS